MMKIMMISNMERFFRVIDRCKGEVILNLPDSRKCNLKQDGTAFQMLKLMKLGACGLDISLTHSDDLPIFIQYMMEAAQN